MKIIGIDMTFNRVDDQGRAFDTYARIGVEESWNQWGGSTEQLGESVDLIEAIRAAAVQFLQAPDEADEV